MYNSQPYYYHRNLQGDVIAIYDANGEKQVEYAYDAWGNCEVVYADNDKIAYVINSHGKILCSEIKQARAERDVIIDK